MEPPPFGSGNLRAYGRVALKVAQLQWSHRLSAVETAVSMASGNMAYLPASMEPPPFGSGNLDMTAETLAFL